MPDENTGNDPAKTETDQLQDDQDTEKLSDIVEGIEDEDSETSDKTADKETSPTGEEDKKAESESKDDTENLQGQLHTLETTVKDMKKHNSDLNGAVARYRKQVKELQENKKGDKEEQLSDDQLKQLMVEHADDKDTMFNIMKYMRDQGATQAGEKMADLENVKKIKAFNDQNITKLFPEAAKEGSQARTTADQMKANLGLNEHPAGDFLALSSVLVAEIPDIQKQAYDQGRSDERAGKLEANRKKGIKDNSLDSVSGDKTKAKSSGMSGSMAETAKQMGLSKSATKIMEKLVSKKSKTVEA